MDENKVIVAAFFREVAAKGILEAARSHGTEEFTWWICGMGDVTTDLPKLSTAFTKIFDERGMVIIPLRMISEGCHVAVEAVTDCRLRSGEEYKNSLSYWITMSSSKIASLREYFDGAYGQNVIGSTLAAALADLHEGVVE